MMRKPPPLSLWFYTALVVAPVAVGLSRGDASALGVVVSGLVLVLAIGVLRGSSLAWGLAVALEVLFLASVPFDENRIWLAAVASAAALACLVAPPSRRFVAARKAPQLPRHGGWEET
jgi:hypothetical protein